MQILILTDIHANVRALQAILDRFRTADQVWCLGDIVEFGPSPSECIQLVRERCDYVVQGNHDVSFAEYDPNSDSPNVWAACGHRKGDAAYVRQLPMSSSVAVNGTSYLLVHGSPRDPLRGGLRPYAEIQALQAELDGCEEDVIVGGHTHMAMAREVSGKLVVNAGTVGQPRDGDYRAQCMLLEDGRFRFVRVAYDLEALREDYRRTSLPQDVKTTWFEYTRRGVVDVHGLQLGPFSDSSTPLV